MIVRTCFSATLVAFTVLSTPVLAVDLAGPTAASRLVTTHGGMRFRAFGAPTQQEVYVGRTSLGTGANRAAGDTTWVNGANSFSFSYDKASDALSGVVNGGSAVTFANFFGGLDPAKKTVPINSLEIQIRDTVAGSGTLALSDLKLNGNLLAPSSFAAPENGAWSYLLAFGKFSKNFTLSGNLDLTGVGTFPASAEGNRVEFVVGNAVPEPASWAMMVAGFGIVGYQMRRRKAMASIAA
jgi:hypothetical protein